MAQVAGDQDTCHEAAAFGVGAGYERGVEKLIEAVTQFRCEFAALFSAVEGERERGGTGGVQARSHNQIGIGPGGVQQGSFPPPDVADDVRQDAGESLVANVGGGEVLLEGLVGEGV